MDGIRLQTNSDKETESSRISYSEALFHALFHYMSSCVAVYVAVDDGEDFIFLDFNRAAELAVKLKREEVIGIRLTDCFPSVREFGLITALKRVRFRGNPLWLPLQNLKITLDCGNSGVPEDGIN